jgi:predicted 3-demethylubiquinone-9 3-methyltransferase (glyoxalase superfamily)
MLHKIKPFLWFDRQAEEAAQFYCSIFKDSRIRNVDRYPDGAPGGMDGRVMIVNFQLEGLELVALNGGPMFKFTEAISFSISTETQDETDYFWDKLTADGGQESQCGWLKDKFGLSWQVVPTALGKLLGDPDKAKAQRAMQAMLQMRKIDIAALYRAAG